MRHIPKPIQYLLLALLLLLALFPLAGGALFGERQEFLMQQITYILILAIVALSLDLLVGITGMVSLAQAAFFGIAGYSLVLLAPEFEAVSIWVALPLCLGISALAALLMGLLIIRTSGIFFIMVTIAFSQMLFYLFHDAPFAGGSDGAFLTMKPSVMIGDLQLLDLENHTTLYYVVLASMVGVYLLLRTFLRAPFGKVLLGIKANEERVRALGYNPTYYKLAVFVIAGTIAGYAGMLAATQYGFVSPSQVGWELSAHVLVMVILGGMGNFAGAIVGAFAFEYVMHFFKDLTKHWQLLMGSFIVLVVVFAPRGLLGVVAQLSKKREAP